MYARPIKQYLLPYRIVQITLSKLSLLHQVRQAAIDHLWYEAAFKE